MAMSAAFALCARSVGPHLPGVLKNLESLAALYDRAGFVFIENDSDDDTKAQLKAWADAHADATLIDLDGLDARGLKFTARMAVCRNACIDFIKASPLAAFDHLVVLDADNVNRGPIDLEGFARGRDWLEREGAAAVFANSRPFYYDIFALRHPVWCPRNPNDDVRQRPPDLDADAARQRYVHDRQILIPGTADPIEVQSAFGGLAIYRMAEALQGVYAGLSPEGLQTCEHVSFNRDVAGSGRGLYILPWMTVGTERAGVRVPDNHRTLTLEQSGRSCELAVPPGHRIDESRRVNPRHDRRLPILARLTGDAAPKTFAIEVGAKVGETLARCRLEGADLRFIAVEASLQRLKYLAFNRRRLPGLLGDVEMAWNSVGRPPGGANFEAPPHTTLEDISRSHGVAAGQLSVVKLGADGFLRDELAFLKTDAPIVWAEAQTWSSADEAVWRGLIVEAIGTWPHLVAFDSLGLAMVAGETAEKGQAVVDMMADAHRHRAPPNSIDGEPPIYSVDVALFPARFTGVFRAFLRELAELAAG
jgi:hypothetical protein